MKISRGRFTKGPNFHVGLRNSLVVKEINYRPYVDKSDKDGEGSVDLTSCLIMLS